jgi:hypothetical protein
VISPSLPDANDYLKQAMDHSLITASSATHLKIIAVALIGAILVVIVGIAGRASTQTSDVVVKAGTVAAYSSQDRSMVR